MGLGVSGGGSSWWRGARTAGAPCFTFIALTCGAGGQRRRFMMAGSSWGAMLHVTSLTSGAGGQRGRVMVAGSSWGAMLRIHRPYQLGWGSAGAGHDGGKQPGRHASCSLPAPAQTDCSRGSCLPNNANSNIFMAQIQLIGAK